MWIKIVILIVFLGILFSLASGLYYLVSEKHKDSKATVKALSYRIGLSVGLFAFLMLLAALGVIKPHGIAPPTPVTQEQADN